MSPPLHLGLFFPCGDQAQNLIHGKHSAKCMSPTLCTCFVWVFETGSQVAKASHEFPVLLFYLLGAGITGIRHHDQLTLDIFRRNNPEEKNKYPCLPGRSCETGSCWCPVGALFPAADSQLSALAKQQSLGQEPLSYRTSGSREQGPGLAAAAAAAPYNPSSQCSQGCLLWQEMEGTANAEPGDSIRLGLRSAVSLAESTSCHRV